jgi:hypothetical protein
MSFINVSSKKGFVSRNKQKTCQLFLHKEIDGIGAELMVLSGEQPLSRQVCTQIKSENGAKACFAHQNSARSLVLCLK